MVSERICLDGDWHFTTDVHDVGIREQWYRRPLTPYDCWQTLPVPGVWEQHGRDGYEGIGWYRHEFDIPASNHADQLGLCLVGIDETATVWINGVEVMNETAGRQRFACNIDRVLRPGTNTIAIRVPDRGIPGGILLSAWIGPYD
ncbi:MAG: hypothetical protein KKI02_01210, partial [Planctomycetes bacterium]|nr:hypothetical protein [Planctomycetota bacterium]